MASLFAAALFFDGIHFLVSGTVLRTKIVGLIGGSPLTMYLENRMWIGSVCKGVLRVERPLLLI
jgi:hypothetical protein